MAYYNYSHKTGYSIIPCIKTTNHDFRSLFPWFLVTPVTPKTEKRHAAQGTSLHATLACYVQGWSQEDPVDPGRQAPGPGGNAPKKRPTFGLQNNKWSKNA